MHIIQDTREQKPLTFDHEYVEGVIIKGLKVGDYCCQFKNGYEPNIIFERKSIDDLYGTLGDGYPRFKRSIDRAAENDIRLILVIEGTLSKVMRGTEYSSKNPISIVRTLMTLFFKYDLIPVFCKDRVEMAFYIAEFYSAIGRKALKDAKKTK